MKEVGRLSRAEAAVLPLDDANPLQRAKAALEAGDHDAARHYLAQARLRIPSYVLTSPDTIRILVGLGDYDAAEAFTLDGAKRFPRKAQYLEGYALTAEKRRDFEEAARRWAVVRRKFPYSWQAYAFGAGCLRQLGRLDEAAAVIERGKRAQPNEILVLIEYGRITEAQQAWDKAWRHWDSVRDKHPIGYSGAAYALFRLGRRIEAEKLLEEGRNRYRADGGIPTMSARIAEEANEPDEAAARWALVRRYSPYDPGGYLNSLRFLRGRGQWAEADAVALTAIERFPKQEWPLLEYAQLAQLRQDWPAAAARWQAVRTAFPGNKSAWQFEARALEAVGQKGEAARVRTAEQSGPAA